MSQLLGFQGQMNSNSRSSQPNSPSSPQGVPIPTIRNPHSSWTGGTLITPSSGQIQGGQWGGGEAPVLMEGLDDLNINMMEEDIFKGPTLAELNAPDADTLLDGLTFDDLYWPFETPSPQTGNPTTDPDGDIVFQIQPSSSFPPLNPNAFRLATSVPISSAVELKPQIQQIQTQQQQQQQQQQQAQAQAQQQQQQVGLRELLLRRELQNSLDSPDASPLGQSLPRTGLQLPTTGSSFSTARLSSSAPTTNQGVWESWQQRREAVWQRRDPRPHLISTGSLAEQAGGSTSSLSAADVLSPGGALSLSMDEGLDSDQLSDGDSSDEESEVSDTESTASGTRSRERFFWQYNVQAKGPKGQRLVLAPTQEDPHVLQKPTDPVFSPLCHIQGIKHSGKARKGDGNDLTPNPRKLNAIGKELDRLNKVIAEMTPVSDLPNAVKTKSRKEKNKLASRACRLKKKAQHEANKLKLYGLEQEHKRLMTSIEQSRQIVFAKIDGAMVDTSEPLTVKVERISKFGTRHRIAGHTTEFVNKVLEKVKQGVPDGGIGEL